MTVLIQETAEPPTTACRPSLTELRLPAFAVHRGVVLPLGPLTFLDGPSGSGKSVALRACAALSGLGGGGTLDEVFTEPAACVPEQARPDAQKRRGFRLGCTVEGPAGPVRLDLAVQAEPELRLVHERLTANGLTLLESALRDPGQRSVQAAWHTGGAAAVTRGPLPDDRLGVPMLPLRVAGMTDGQRLVLSAAEQAVVALRSVFVCDPRPELMRAPVKPGSGRLLSTCDNLAEVLRRTRTECGHRHCQVITAVRAGCAGPVNDLRTEELPDGRLRAVIDRGDGTVTPLDRLSDGELRYIALALVLLTGPGVLELDPVAEVPSAFQSLTVLVDDFDRGLDIRQLTELTRLASRMVARGHIRLVASIRDMTSGLLADQGVPGNVVHLGP